MQILSSGIRAGLSFNLYLKITAKFCLTKKKLNFSSIEHSSFLREKYLIFNVVQAQYFSVKKRIMYILQLLLHTLTK